MIWTSTKALKLNKRRNTSPSTKEWLLDLHQVRNSKQAKKASLRVNVVEAEKQKLPSPQKEKKIKSKLRNSQLKNLLKADR
jgi:hypothetical protein